MNDPIIDAVLAKRQKEAADKLSRKLQSIAKVIEKELRKYGSRNEGPPMFSLFVYTQGSAQYVANAHRDDVKTIVASVLARWDNTPELHVPSHEKSLDDFIEEKKDPL